MLCRTEKLIGSKLLNKLINSNVLIVGVGGVGGCVFEMLLRSGIGKITIVDDDIFEISNLNRQILSSKDTIGKSKVYVGYERAKKINPNVIINAICKTFNQNNARSILTSEKYDIVVDCIDRISDKVQLIVKSHEIKLHCISAMGAGFRLSSDYLIDDIFNIKNDKLAKSIRPYLRKFKIDKHIVVAGTTPPLVPFCNDNIIGSISFAVNAMGCKLSEYVVKYLLGIKEFK